MVELKLKHNSTYLAESLGISEEREGELESKFLDITEELSKEGKDMKTSDIIGGIAALDITLEEYTYMILQLGIIESRRRISENPLSFLNDPENE